MAGLEIDGPRPSFGWVTSLPQGWTAPAERIVLIVLAADAFADVSAPGGDDLTRWCGMHRSTVYGALASLQKQNLSRPALIERVGDDGRVMPPGARAGGRNRRTRYRLRTEIDPGKQSGDSGRFDAGNSPAIPDGIDAGNSPAEPDGIGPKQSEKQSEKQSGKQSGETGHSLPYPSLPSSSPQVTPDRARLDDEHLDDGVIPSHPIGRPTTIPADLCQRTRDQIRAQAGEAG